MIDIEALNAASAHLREDAAYNLSWTDERAKKFLLDPLSISEIWIARRREVAAERTRWADAIDHAINELSTVASRPNVGDDDMEMVR